MKTSSVMFWCVLSFTMLCTIGGLILLDALRPGLLWRSAHPFVYLGLTLLALWKLERPTTRWLWGVSVFAIVLWCTALVLHLF